ncbi:unnamed protein product [Polarella glacialis]|uniref:Uncharacterized protein n=1 Tax=Polarella glacialis TaxID=89957 RepID=A0A813HRW4_POLGL|nr:unnamed protein product [Polarella glacialis]
MAAPRATAGRHKGNPDSRLLAALSDARLKGHEQAVYFTLRGLGMPAIEGPGSAPRIEVFAAQQPQLFSALRRLGLRHDGKRLVIEPREELMGTDADRSPGHSPAGQRAPSSSSPDLRGSRLSPLAGVLEEDEKGGGAALGASQSLSRSLSSSFGSSRRRRKFPRPSAAEHDEFFEKMAWPKDIGGRQPFWSQLLAETQLPPLGSPTGSDGAASRSRSAGSWGAGSNEFYEEEEEVVPLPWIPLPKRQTLEEQRRYSSMLSAPLLRCTRKKLSRPVLSGPTPAGLAAQRDFIARLAKVKLKSQEAAKERSNDGSSQLEDFEYEDFEDLDVFGGTGLLQHPPSSTGSQYFQNLGEWEDDLEEQAQQ